MAFSFQYGAPGEIVSRDTAANPSRVIVGARSIVLPELSNCPSTAG
jgi:hypothetical protein